MRREATCVSRKVNSESTVRAELVACGRLAVPVFFLDVFVTVSNGVDKMWFLCSGLNVQSKLNSSENVMQFG